MSTIGHAGPMVRAEVRSQLEESLARLLADLPRARARGDDLGVGRVLTAMGRIHVKLREWDSAEECFEEAEEMVQGAGGGALRPGLDVGRAELHFHRGEVEAARTLLEGVVAELAAGEDVPALAEATTLLGTLHRRLHGLERKHLQLVEAWGESIESKDHYTAGHCDRVARYTCALAKALGYAAEDLRWLRIGAFLHDVGKTAVPAQILNKPGKLTAREWELMKSHTVVGDQMVAELHFPWDLRPIVRSHHERWDGTGYPDGLAGTDIPLNARILCVADVFDALTTTRSYRSALSRATAFEVMDGEVGRTLDPSLFSLFRSTIQELEHAERAPH